MHGKQSWKRDRELQWESGRCFRVRIQCALRWDAQSILSIIGATIPTNSITPRKITSIRKVNLLLVNADAQCISRRKRQQSPPCSSVRLCTARCEAARLRGYSRSGSGRLRGLTSLGDSGRLVIGARQGFKPECPIPSVQASRSGYYCRIPAWFLISEIEERINAAKR